GHGDLSMAVKAMKAGAADFIEKPYAAEDLVQKVKEAIESTRAIAGGAPGVEGGDRSALQIAKLSPRERQVFDVLVVGHTNKEIARRLDISPRTVEVHRAHIMEKTNVRGLSQLVRMALDAGHELRDD
ncbi:MAG: LuxR C-terminal-related transcriptional regulator, partial [Alphaproteobacteria bacterium]|nr:LuxR C-terminal-related transcriptional regulator [Alphaproteobacteria bacterium]